MPETKPTKKNAVILYSTGKDKKDNTFKTEAERAKPVLNKKYGNTEIIEIPYGNQEELKKVLAKYKDADIFPFDHSGDKIMGIPVTAYSTATEKDYEELEELYKKVNTHGVCATQECEDAYIKKAREIKAKQNTETNDSWAGSFSEDNSNCVYWGSCTFAKHAAKFTKKSNIPSISTVDKKWQGVGNTGSPINTEDDFLKQMYYNSDYQYNKPQQRNIEVKTKEIPIIKAVSDFKNGGFINKNMKKKYSSYCRNGKMIFTNGGEFWKNPNNQAAMGNLAVTGINSLLPQPTMTGDFEQDMMSQDKAYRTQGWVNAGAGAAELGVGIATMNPLLMAQGAMTGISGAKNLISDSPYKNAMQKYKQDNNVFGQRPMGGPIGNQAEIELGETIMTPPNQFAQVEHGSKISSSTTQETSGPSHEQGGNDISAPDGTYIFSDKLSPDGKKTFADYAKKLGRQKGKVEEEIEGVKKLQSKHTSNKKLMGQAAVGTISRYNSRIKNLLGEVETFDSALDQLKEGNEDMRVEHENAENEFKYGGYPIGDDIRYDEGMPFNYDNAISKDREYYNSNLNISNLANKEGMTIEQFYEKYPDAETYYGSDTRDLQEAKYGGYMSYMKNRYKLALGGEVNPGQEEMKLIGKSFFEKPVPQFSDTKKEAPIKKYVKPKIQTAPWANNAFYQNNPYFDNTIGSSVNNTIIPKEGMPPESVFDKNLQLANISPENIPNEVENEPSILTATESYNNPWNTPKSTDVQAVEPDPGLLNKNPQEQLASRMPKVEPTTLPSSGSMNKIDKPDEEEIDWLPTMSVLSNTIGTLGMDRPGVIQPKRGYRVPKMDVSMYGASEADNNRNFNSLTRNAFLNSPNSAVAMGNIQNAYTGAIRNRNQMHQDINKYNLGAEGQQNQIDAEIFNTNNAITTENANNQAGFKNEQLTQLNQGVQRAIELSNQKDVSKKRMEGQQKALELYFAGLPDELAEKERARYEKIYGVTGEKKKYGGYIKKKK